MHLDEGALQALLDGELDAAAVVAVRQHLDACGDCRTRFEELRQDEELLRRVLPALDQPRNAISAGQLISRARAERRLHRLRWAAVIAFLVIGAGALYAVPGSPLRRWIDQLAGRRAAVEAPAGVALPPGARFHITFAATPASAGRVTIRLTDDSIIDARSLNAPARFVAEIDGLRIEPLGPGTEFAIGIPRAAPWVDVVAGGRRILLKDAARIVTDAAPDSLGRYVLTLPHP